MRNICQPQCRLSPRKRSSTSWESKTTAGYRLPSTSTWWTQISIDLPSKENVSYNFTTLFFIRDNLFSTHPVSVLIWQVIFSLKFSLCFFFLTWSIIISATTDTYITTTDTITTTATTAATRLLRLVLFPLVYMIFQIKNTWLRCRSRPDIRKHIL